MGLTVVLCPWHKFMVSIDGGLKVFQGVDVIGGNNVCSIIARCYKRACSNIYLNAPISKGKPVVSGWKVGKMVQRSHKIKECVSGIYVVK